MNKIKQDLLENYSLTDLELLAKYYQLSANISLNKLLEAVAEANQRRQKANMLPHSLTVYENIVKELSLADMNNFCRSDPNFAMACKDSSIWKIWAEAHPAERDAALTEAVENNKSEIIKGLKNGGATMLSFTEPVHEALVKGMSFKDMNNLCRTDRKFAKYCQSSLLWRIWAEAHPAERDDALFRAIMNNKLNIVKGLFDGGADLRDSYADTRDLRDIMEKHDLSQRLKRGGWSNHKSGNIDMIKLVLSKTRFDFNKDLTIVKASSNGYTDIVKLLLADPMVDPTINNNRALHSARRRGRDEIVKLLLADPRVAAFEKNYKY